MLFTDYSKTIYIYVEGNTVHYYIPVVTYKDRRIVQSQRLVTFTVPDQDIRDEFIRRVKSDPFVVVDGKKVVVNIHLRG